MIKVKDTKRLKAFGFDYEERLKHFQRFVDEQNLLVVDENSQVHLFGMSDKLLDVFFDLQAAGLLERVEDNGKEEKA